MSKALVQRVLGRTGARVTFLGFGALSIGRHWGLGKDEVCRRPDEAGAAQVLHGVLDRGINLIDTASAYHESERRIGDTLRERRNEYILTSKCGEHNEGPDSTVYDFSYRAVKESIDRSLNLLQTDVIDVMQIHFGPDPMGVLDAGETVQAMQEAQQAGKIKWLGASVDADVAARCIEMDCFDIMQMQVHLLDDRNLVNLERCAEKNIGVLVRGALGRGLFTERVRELPEDHSERVAVEAMERAAGGMEAVTQYALQYLHELNGVTTVLVGTKNLDHLDHAIRLTDAPLDENIRAAMREVLGK